MSSERRWTTTGKLISSSRMLSSTTRRKFPTKEIQIKNKRLSEIHVYFNQIYFSKSINLNFTL
jgi:hypothetical protein